jgi:Nif-specific regulatory protein
MSDIVANLLHLSSEAGEVEAFLEPALDLAMTATHAEAAAIAVAALPEWTVLAVRAVVKTAVPLELAAEALERDDMVASDRWVAAPLVLPAGDRGHAAEPGYVLLLRGSLSKPQAGAAAKSLSDALSVVERHERAGRQIGRLRTILEITHEWHQTNEMETLLVRMAEAATRLLDADRASIFLWDKANRTIVGRPALGVPGGELRLSDDSGIVGQVIQTGEPRRVSSLHDARAIDRAVDRQTGYRTKTILCVPLVSPHGDRLGAFEVLNKRDGIFTGEDQRELVELAAYAAVSLENTQQFAELLERHEKMVDQAAQDTLLVGESPSIRALRATVRRIADTDLAVLLLGENGTGKEVVARLIHFGSRRRKHPFIAVNCAALTETLLESELFGHEKGAFTDAHEARAGKFELASGGTLFLDEIGDMSLAGQAKLLRVLEEKTIVRVGGSKSIHTDVRVIAATNQKLADLVRAKRFREDLGAGRRCDAAGRSFSARILSPGRSQTAEVHRRCQKTLGKPHLARQCPRAAEPDGTPGLFVSRRSDRCRRVGVHPLADGCQFSGHRCRDDSQRCDAPIPGEVHQASDRTGQGQCQPGGQKPWRPPLEPISQDATARNGNRRGGITSFPRG